jgi:hypothetical protein
MLVIFDDCWNPNPQIGSQPAPKSGIHNSGWVQSPGVSIVNSGASTWDRLERYVIDMIGSFTDDERILLWDLYNEPGNSNNGEKSLPLVKSVFAWARSVNPSQPLTAGIWFENQKLNEFQLAASDIITFHNYSPANRLEAEIAKLQTYGRPLICTEWMARICGSLVSTNLPIFARERIGCLNWGLVSGKTNTIYQWQIMPDFVTLSPSLEEEETEPKLWFHDLFCPDGTPYDSRETELFKMYTANSSPLPSRLATINFTSKKNFSAPTISESGLN